MLALLGARAYALSIALPDAQEPLGGVPSAARRARERSSAASASSRVIGSRNAGIASSAERDDGRPIPDALAGIRLAAEEAG